MSSVADIPNDVSQNHLVPYFDALDCAHFRGLSRRFNQLFSSEETWNMLAQQYLKTSDKAFSFQIQWFRDAICDGSVLFSDAAVKRVIEAFMRVELENDRAVLSINALSDARSTFFISERASLSRVDPARQLGDTNGGGMGNGAQLTLVQMANPLHTPSREITELPVRNITYFKAAPPLEVNYQFQLMNREVMAEDGVDFMSYIESAADHTQFIWDGPPPHMRDMTNNRSDFLCCMSRE